MRAILYCLFDQNVLYDKDLIDYLLEYIHIKNTKCLK